MAMASAILMGIVPIIIWIFIPAEYVLLNSIIIVFSAASLATTTVDIKNAILAIVKVASDGYIQGSGNKVYWFK